MTTFPLGWLALSCITAAILCRLIHKSKVRDEQVAIGINGSIKA